MEKKTQMFSTLLVSPISCSTLPQKRTALLNTDLNSHEFTDVAVSKNYEERGRASMDVYDNKLFLFGGWVTTFQTNDIHVLDLEIDNANKALSGEWTQKTHFKYPEWFKEKVRVLYSLYFHRNCLRLEFLSKGVLNMIIVWLSIVCDFGSNKKN